MLLSSKRVFRYMPYSILVINEKLIQRRHAYFWLTSLEYIPVSEAENRILF